MGQREKLAGIRLGLTYGAGLVLLGLVIAMIVSPAPVAAAPVAAAPAAEAVVSAPALVPLAGTVRQAVPVSGVARAQRIGFAITNVQPGPDPLRPPRRVFVFTPVPGHELPALMLPPPATRGQFIAAHADRAVLVSAPK